MNDDDKDTQRVLDRLGIYGQRRDELAPIVNCLRDEGKSIEEVRQAIASGTNHHRPA